MTLQWIDTWGSTAAERSVAYPCDMGDEAHRDLYRAVTVNAPPEIVFRWLCQLRKAPYSYDLLDNWGRRSPRELTRGLEHLAKGQRVMKIFTIVSFAKDEHITVALTDRTAIGVFGPLVLSYVVRGLPKGGTRLVVKVRLASSDDSSFARARRRLLAAGDLFMMRKQLLTLKELAEREAA